MGQFLAVTAAGVNMADADLDKKLEEFQRGFERALSSLKSEVAELRAEIKALKSETKSEPPVTAEAPGVTTLPVPVPESAQKTHRAPTAKAPPPEWLRQEWEERQTATPEAVSATAEPAKPPTRALESAPARPQPATPIPPVSTPLREDGVPSSSPGSPAQPPPAALTSPRIPALHAASPTAPPAPLSTPSMPVPALTPPTAPAKPPGERLKSALAVEEVLGTNWLNKLGIALVVLGVASFGIYELGRLGPAGKVLLSVAAGAGLLAAGILFERRERYCVLGRTGIGGGWALLFFTAYAVYHVPAMRLPLPETGDLLLMLVVAAVMALHTLRYRSQLVTGLAFLLGYSTLTLSHDTVYSLSAGVVLALALVALVIRMNWYELEVFGILASYLNHLYWLYKILGPEGANRRQFSEFWASTVILLLYWLAYRSSYVLRKIRSPLDEHVSALAALLNTILLLAAMKFQSARPELAFYALLALGALEFACGQLSVTKRRRTAFVILSTMGAILMITAVPFHYSGGDVALLWLIGGEIFLASGIAVEENVFCRLGLLAGLAAALHVVFVDAEPFVALRLRSEGPLVPSGVLFLTLGVLYYANSQALHRRWKEMFSGTLERTLMGLHSYLGAVALPLGAWALWTGDWTVLAWAAVVLVLGFAAGRLQAADLFLQSSLLGAVAFCRALVVNLGASVPAGYAHRLIAAPLLAAAYYLAARFMRQMNTGAQKFVRRLYTWAGSALIAVLIWRELPVAWVAAGWMALALALTLAGRRFKAAELCYQENVLALAALVHLVYYNFTLESTYGHFTLRLITVSLTAAALYIASRRSSLPESGRRWTIACLHTWAATGLLAVLAWYEASTVWLAVLWALFAAILALLDRRFEASDLRWQAHSLAALTALRAIVVNLQDGDRLHGISLRLVSVAIVVVVLYALSRLIRMPEEYRERDLHHAYSWAATGLTGALMWYELPPSSVAVAWGVFGLLLVETGLFRSSLQIRLQGYVALGSAFVRIFFANLDLPATPGELVSSRILTVVPVALILFFIYWQLEKRKGTLRESRAHIDGILCYAGTIAVAALLYCELTAQADWIVTAWSALLPALFAAALLLRRTIFLHQGLWLAGAALWRGVFHNLFGETYFSGAGWTGRYAVLGSAIAIMFLTLPLAFRLRRLSPAGSAEDAPRWRQLLVGRPEQAIFFVPFLLLTPMLALKLRAGMVTVAWGVEAVLIIVLALRVGERSYRLTGLALLLLCVGKIAILDAWRLQPRDRYLTLIVLGAALLTVSFLYSRYRETIRQLL
jgi:hypothetical protein